MPNKTHPQVEYHVDRETIGTLVTNDPIAAMSAALLYAISHGTATMDVCIFSESGARDFGGDDAVEFYREDPEASVFERFEITVNMVGRVP